MSTIVTGGYMATNVLISTVDFERSSTCLMPSIDGDPYIDYRTTATRCKEPCVDGVVRALHTVVRRDPWYTQQRGLISEIRPFYQGSRTTVDDVYTVYTAYTAK